MSLVLGDAKLIKPWT